MGGGSADAAAALRLLARRSGLGDAALLLELAAALGADVAGQLRPGRVLARGAGERRRAARRPGRRSGCSCCPRRRGSATAAVYREADRLGRLRSARELAALDPLASVGGQRPRAGARARSSRRSPRRSSARARPARGTALVCGSGPTVIGLFDEPREAARAAAALAAQGVEAIAAEPVMRAAARAADPAAPALSDNPGTVSRPDVTYLVAGVCGVLGLAAFVGLILVPAVSALQRAWQRLVAARPVVLRARRDGRDRSRSAPSASY